MNKLNRILMFGLLLLGLASCKTNVSSEEAESEATTEFQVESERFADIQVLRYEVPGWDELTLQQKKLAYYLSEAALSGRDIIYDQKFEHNLPIRKTIDAIYETYTGDKTGEDWKNFDVYAKRVWFSNGIHHHYSQDKIMPDFSAAYFGELVKNSDQSKLPLNGKSVDEFISFYTPIMFDENMYAKAVNLDADVDHVQASANNFYGENITEKEVAQFYASKTEGVENAPMFGLNSKLIKENGQLIEKTWMVGGMYGPAIEKIVYWLEKAVTVAENDVQKDALQKLVEYYKTGDLKKFDEYSIAWVKDTASRIDAINGFIEVYGDAVGKRGSYESVVSFKDMEATKRISAIGAQAQWFEDNSPIMDEHKKESVKGISAKVITVVMEAGDASPSTPIGINLPNSNWIREQHGSKSVSLGNIVDAYNKVSSKSPAVEEFGHSQEVIDRIRKHGALAGELHTDMHEVIGHASGKLNEGIATPDQTLKNYANTLEEGRADLVALYFIMDQKLVELGVMPSLEVGKAEYDNYIMNGLMMQLNRIELGDNIEEAHMRNRQMIAKWAFEKGAADSVIEKVVREGKTYFVINDYEKLRGLFGELLREIQRIKSEGDFEAGKALVENYGVKVDQELHKEIKERFSKLNIAPYKGFIQPKLVPVMEGEEIIDVKIEYPDDFAEQMLGYGKEYSFLPVIN